MIGLTRGLRLSVTDRDADLDRFAKLLVESIRTSSDRHFKPRSFERQRVDAWLSRLLVPC